MRQQEEVYGFSLWLYIYGEKTLLLHFEERETQGEHTLSLNSVSSWSYESLRY